MNLQPLLQRFGNPAVAVAGDHDDGLFRVGAGQLLRVPHHISQMDHQVGLMFVHRRIHIAQRAVGVGKDENSERHLGKPPAYTKVEICFLR